MTYLTHAVSLLIGLVAGLELASRTAPSAEPCLGLVSEPGRSYIAESEAGEWIEPETGAPVGPDATTHIQPVGSC